MDAPSTSAAALKLEIARLSGAIDRHKTSESRYPPRPKSNVYINPNYKPPSKPSRPPLVQQHKPPSQQRPPSINPEKHDVVIGGVTFESSGRSLVRKDLSKPVSTGPSKPTVRPPSSHAAIIRIQAGTLHNANRNYKSRTSRRPQARNMTLNNTKRPYQSRRLATKRKYSDKPCPRFTTTGSCNRGLTCMYQHDPAKIAICWKFLQGNCPNTAETCPLSHDPTPERTPLCVHFANNGRCTRANCPFPHVRVGQREGICRDFAVLGYCEKGLDCDKQHIRECPDFAEKGECTKKGCKLPHVIRANRNRKTLPTDSSTALTAQSVDSSAGQSSSSISTPSVDMGADHSSSHPVTAEDAQLGDEFISLTFHESESEDEEDDGEGDEEDEDEDADEAESDQGIEYPDQDEIL